MARYRTEVRVVVEYDDGNPLGPTTQPEHRDFRARMLRSRKLRKELDRVVRGLPAGGVVGVVISDPEHWSGGLVALPPEPLPIHE